MYFALEIYIGKWLEIARNSTFLENVILVAETSQAIYLRIFE